MTRAVLRLLAVTLACAMLPACGGIGRVEPWEKGTLAQPAMRFDGDPLDARFTQHVYSSRENTSGGAGVGGGGCGCN
jgi:hypothetical protein